MTVADNTSRNQYTATSGQTVFAYTFEIVDKSHIVVLKNGVALSEGTNYTVSNVGNDSGGNITLTVGATTGDIITFYRDMPYSRTQNYTNSGDFLASEVNSDFDDLWLAGEQTDRSFSQSIRKPITDSDSISMELPVAASRANKYLSFGPTGAVAVQQTAPATDASTVTYTPAGTGAVDTTVQAKLRESVSVKDFGATGDAVTDDTAAIQAAIDSLAGVGGTIFIPKGIYLLSSAVVVTDTAGITLVGEGSESSILRQSSDTSAVVEVGGNHNCVEHLLIQHSPSVDYTKTGAIGLRLVDLVSHSSFRDLRFGGSCYGIRLTTKDTSAAAVFSCTFDNIYILPYARIGIELTAVASGSTGNVFNNIYINGLVGSPATAGNTVAGVYVASMTESAWNQLNIEHAQLANAFVCFGGETMVINSMHLEALTPKDGPEGTNCDFSGYIRSSNKALVVNGLSIINSTYDGNNAASYSVFHSINGSRAEFHGFVTRSNTKISSIITDFYTPDSVANNGFCYLWNPVDSDGAGVVEFNYEPNVFINGSHEGQYTATLTPSTSGTITLQSGGDAVRYTKVGRRVVCQSALVVDSISSAVGSYVKVNLPFPKLNIPENSEANAAPATFYNGSYSVIPGYIPGSATSEYHIVIDPSTLSSGNVLYVLYTYLAD